MVIINKETIYEITNINILNCGRSDSFEAS